MAIVKGPTPGVVTVAGIAAAVTAALMGVGVSLWIAVEDHQSVLTAGFNAAVAVAFAAVGSVVAAARPRNRVGWLMLIAGATWALGGAGVDLAHHGIVTDPGTVPGASAYAVLGAAIRAVGWYVVTLAVPAYFPDGRLAGPRWRWLSRVLVVIVIASVIDPLADKQADLTNLGSWHNPIAPGRPWDLVGAVAFLAHIPLSLVATIGIVAQLRARWRQGEPLLRQQLTLFVGAAILPIVAVPIVFGVGYDTGTWVFGAAALPLPIAIGFAVLARGLYDLRTAANRTLVWVTLSAIIAGLYALTIAALGSQFQAHGAPWLAWVAAVVITISFAPLRDTLQRGINRLTFGRWDEPYEVLASLGQRLEASADADRLLADVVSELHGLGLAEVAIVDLTGETLAGEPAATQHPVLHPLSAFGQPVGTLRYRTPTTPLRNRDRRLLDDLAGHLGGVLHAHRLTRDVQHALERQVLAREEERRRLRRDLHDGLGPALAGHLLRLDVIARKLGRDSPASAEITELREELGGTVAEVRRVVEGLRPPVLHELGLAGALAQVLARLTAASPVALDLQVAALPPLSAALEVAAFRIVTEAVTNVVRHADATNCRVRLEARDAVLLLSVVDDGRGLDPRRGPAGHGLHTMRERAEELRGQLHITTHDGTTVLAELPLPSGARSAAAPASAAASAPAVSAEPGVVMRR